MISMWENLRQSCLCDKGEFQHLCLLSFLFLHLFWCLWVLACALCLFPQRLEEGDRSFGAGVTDVCQLPCGFWELNLKDFWKNKYSVSIFQLSFTPSNYYFGNKRKMIFLLFFSIPPPKTGPNFIAFTGKMVRNLLCRLTRIALNSVEIFLPPKYWY